MELEAALRGTKVVELINVPHRAWGLLQEFLVNGPGRPAPEQEWPPPQQGVLSRVVRVRFESPALARMGLRRLEEAMPTVVGHREWRVLADLRWPQERGRDQAPEWRVDFKNFPESKVKSLPMLILAGPLLQGPARGGGRSGAGGAEARHQEGEQSSDGDTSEYSGSSSEEVDAPGSGGAAGGAGGGGPGGQREICGGGGFWQNDSDGMNIGGRATPEDWDGQQEIDNGSGEDNGGAAEEMDQDGSGVGGLSGRVHPAGWATKTKSQKRGYWRRRRK